MIPWRGRRRAKRVVSCLEGEGEEKILLCDSWGGKGEEMRDSWSGLKFAGLRILFHFSGCSDAEQSCVIGERA